MKEKQSMKKTGSSKKDNVISVIIVITFSIIIIISASYAKSGEVSNYLTIIIEDMGIPTTAFVPTIEYYFSNDGSESNDGLSPDNPLKDPTPFFNTSGASLFLKSGDVFYLDEAYLTNSNIMISSYGDTEKAIISGLKTSSNTFSKVSDEIYSVILNDSEIGALIEGGNLNWSRVSRHDYLCNSGDYYFDAGTRTLYKKSIENIEGTTVQYSLGKNAIKLSGASQVIIQNIEICNYGRHGVNIGSSCSNITVDNCYIHNIGGAELSTNVKYGNAIQVWSDNCHSITISNNTVKNIYDTGITAQNSKNSGAVGNSTNIIIKNNNVSNCYWGMEFYNNQQSCFAECYVEYNTVTDIRDITNGYRWDKAGVVGEHGGANALRFVGVNPNDRYYISNNIFANSEDAALFIVHDISGGIAQFSNNTFSANSPLLLADPSYYDGESDTFNSLEANEYYVDANGSTIITDESVAKTNKLHTFDYSGVLVCTVFLLVITFFILIINTIKKFHK